MAVRTPRRAASSFEDTVRSRLLRLAVLLLLPGLSLAAMVTWQSLDADRTAAETQLRDSVELLAADVDADLGQTEAQLRLLAASSALARGDVGSFAALAGAVTSFGTRIVLRDPAGHWLVDTGAQGTAAAARTARVPIPWDMRATGRPVLTWGPGPSGHQAVAITVPVESGGLHVFNLTAFVPQTRLQDVVGRLQLHDGWFATIFDDGLHVVARSAGADQSVGHTAPAEIDAALRRGGLAVSNGVSQEGISDLFSAAPSPQFGIPIAVMAPVENIYASSRLSLLLLVGVGSVLVSLGLLGALVVSGSISRPIEALAAAARQLGEADVPPSIPGGLIEADEVARAMSAASATLIERRAALSDMNATLAARVTERTTELANANRALEEQRARLGLVLDHMPVGVMVSEPSGQMLYSNREGRRLLGIRDGEDDFADHAPPTVRRQGSVIPLSDAPPALARRGVVTEGEVLTLERSDGVVVELEVSAGPVVDRDGKVALAVTTLQDISARLEAEDARRRSQRLEAIGQLTGGVAHEFNNLLMAIGGCLDLLAPHVRGERAHGLLENAARAADRGAILTRQLLAFARRQHLHTEAVDLNALVVGLAELLGSTLGRAIEVVTDLKPDCWPAVADPTQLELVLLNLAINARDAMPGGGRLVIGTGNAVLGEPRRAEEPAAGEYAMLRVADTGTGMAPDVLARAFEPFFTTKHVGEGTGLGLPHVLGVAQQLGGGVKVQSAPDKGTAVSVFLPRACTVPAPGRRASLRPPRPRALESVRVLLVDDDVEVREIARAMLEEMGAVVIEAKAARDVLLLLRTEPDIDLVLADYTMPHMTGLELAQQIGTMLPGVPVVLMTGYSATTLGDMGPYVRAVLQKPFRAEAMAQVLTEVISGDIVAVGLAETR
jgi:PAS domain S-box-containing protein